MQFSTNRVNFTPSSIAQFNYAKFLQKKRRASPSNVQDIVTVLGLHHENVFIFNDTDTLLNLRKRKNASRSRILVHSNNSVVVYRNGKKIKYTIPILNDCIIVIMCVSGDNWELCCAFNVKICAIVMLFYIKNCVKPLYTLNTEKIINSKRFNIGEILI